MITETTISVPAPVKPEEFNPVSGDIIITECGSAWLVSITDYKNTKLICLNEGTRWSDDPLTEALKSLENQQGKLRIAKKVSVNIEF